MPIGGGLFLGRFSIVSDAAPPCRWKNLEAMTDRTIAAA
jgi:hypothetical protein